ncbi:MAG: NAD-binding protein [Candidatus Micrarchaeota archaeon]|nr:NAD-binding protein [Candidatus Micrarchaeota archaeon]
MANVSRAWFNLVYLVLILFALSVALTWASGTDLFAALLINLLGSLQVYYGIVTIQHPLTDPLLLVANLIDTVIFAMLTVILAAWFYEFISGFSIRGRGVRGRLKSMHEHIIVVPYNPFAATLLKEFKGSGIKAVTIATNRRELLPLYKLNELAISGDIKESGTFEAAGISKAKYVIACSDDDLQNALITITAKTANPKVRIITRVTKEDDIPKLDMAGAYKMILPEVTAGEKIGEEILKRIIG